MKFSLNLKLDMRFLHCWQVQYYLHLFLLPNVTNVHEVMKRSDRFDFSNFPENHPNYSTDYKMIPGKFKDECPDSMIEEVVGHRGKMYSIKKLMGE